MTTHRSIDRLRLARRREIGHDAVVVSEPEARQLAEAEVAKSQLPGGCVIVGSDEFDVGWVYFYDSTLHHETGEFRHTIAGNSPILVDRNDGSVHHTGTARPIAEYIERYKARDPPTSVPGTRSRAPKCRSVSPRWREIGHYALAT